MNPSAPNQPNPQAQAAPEHQFAAGNPGYTPHAAQDAPEIAHSYGQPGTALHYTPAPPPPGQPYPAQIAAPPGAAPAQPAVTHTNPNSTQNTLQIAEIRDGILIMNDGSFR